MKKSPVAATLVISFAITAALATFAILYVTFSHPLADFFDTALFGAVFVSYSGQQRLAPRGPLRGVFRRRQHPSSQVKHPVRRLPRLEKHPLRQSPRALVRPGAPVNDLDNGWRFFSELADDLFVNDPRNLTVCSWSTIVSSNPASPPFRLALWIAFLALAEFSTGLGYCACPILSLF